MKTFKTIYWKLSELSTHQPYNELPKTSQPISTDSMDTDSTHIGGEHVGPRYTQPRSPSTARLFQMSTSIHFPTSGQPHWLLASWILSRILTARTSNIQWTLAVSNRLSWDILHLLASPISIIVVSLLFPYGALYGAFYALKPLVR